MASPTSVATSAGREVIRCSNRLCNTAQDVKETGRKIVSDFFGRNKRETKSIPLAVWHLSCRKDYQRGAYAAKNAAETKTTCDYYLKHIKNQLTRIQLWRPDATFTVQLVKPAKVRLTAYHDALRRNGGNEDAARRAVVVAPKVGSKGESKPLSNADAVEMSHAEHLEANFCGQGKTIDGIMTTVLPWIETEIASGRMIQMPPIEFLLQDAEYGERVIDPSDNYDKWVASCDGETYPEQSTPTSKRKLVLHGPRTPAELKTRPTGMIKLKFSALKNLPKLKLNARSTSTSHDNADQSTSDVSAGPSKKRKTSDHLSSSDIDTPTKKRTKIDIASILNSAVITSSKKRKLSWGFGDLDDTLSKKHKTLKSSPTAMKTSTTKPALTKATMDAFNALPAYQPPGLLSPPTASKKRPAALDLSGISNITGVTSKGLGKARALHQGYEHQQVSAMRSTIDDEFPAAAYTTIGSSPVMARGMVFAAGTKRRILREEIDENFDESESEGESGPSAKEQKA